MIYRALALSKKFILDYKEVNESDREISLAYDFFAFNYHYITMGWLNTKIINKLPGLKITFVLEVSPNNPFILCPSEDFDLYCVLDPTLITNDKRVYAFPRPLEPYKVKNEYIEKVTPIIGSFGFATAGKGFELLIDAVNREFNRAIVRINIPGGTIADGATWKFQRTSYAEYLRKLCLNVAKEGIEVVITHEYMSKDELIEWCAQNTLNCFLYNRNQPGLSATTDQAIMSGRPLAISTNSTFRHIHPYILPYPFQSLRESIQNSQCNVLKMKDDWATENFTRTFEDLIMRQNIVPEKKSRLKKSQLLPKRGLRRHLMEKGGLYLLKIKGNYKEVKTFTSPLNLPKEPFKGTVLFVFNGDKPINSLYGNDIVETLKRSNRFLYHFRECSNKDELIDIFDEIAPDAVIYYYSQNTMPWITHNVVNLLSVPQLGLVQEKPETATKNLFDYYLCPDEKNVDIKDNIIKIKLLIPPYINETSLPEIPTIGSFELNYNEINFERLIDNAQSEFDEVNIRLLMPYVEPDDVKAREKINERVKRCHSLINKPRIKLSIYHNSLDKLQLLDFLAENTINAFIFNQINSFEIINIINYALAVQRPLIINQNNIQQMMNISPSIFIENSSIRQVILNGIVPLVPYYNEWCEASFLHDFDQKILKTITKKEK